MKSHGGFLSATLIASAIGWGAGCGGLPAYQINISAPHKDVLRLLVILEDRAAPETYREIALREVEKARAQSRYWPYPLYEVSVDFRLDTAGRDRLAHVLVRLGNESGSPEGESGSPFPVVETTIY